MLPGLRDMRTSGKDRGYTLAIRPIPDVKELKILTAGGFDLYRCRRVATSLTKGKVHTQVAVGQWPS